MVKKSFILFSFFTLITIMNVRAQDRARGEKLYGTCIECHGEKGLGDRELEAPRISGQFDWYILSQLESFKAKKRHNPKMYPFIKNLNNTDFKDLAAYISTLK